MKPKLVILIFLLLLPIVYASYITIQTTIYSTKDTVNIMAINKGDEPAYNVHPILISPLTSTKAETEQKLDVDEQLKQSFSVDTANLLPGIYPLILNIEYTDANNYPFTAISATTFTYKESTNPGLILSLPSIKLSGSNKLKLSIKSLDEQAKDIKARIVGPKELTIEEPRQLSLAGRNSATLSFKITDFSARPDSVYAVFAIAEYEKDGKHFTSIMPTTVKITKGINIPTSLLIASLAILLAVFVVYKLKKKNESKHSHTDIK